jgi:cell division protein FtsQ
LRAASHALRLGGRTAAVLPRAALSLPPRFRRRLLVILVAAMALAALYQFWFRDSSIVKVHEVSIKGLTTRDAPRVRAALTAAAQSMTTLHVRHDELMQAVRGFPVIRDVQASSDFPNGLRIKVIEYRPAAVVAPPQGGQVAVAADGTILRGLPLDARLPVLRAPRPVGTHVTDPATVRFVRIVGAAPGPLLTRVAQVSSRRGQGVVVQLRRGPLLVFGDLSRLRSKWLAVARVLADPSAAGATYIDVRIPERPAAGGLGAATIAPSPPAGLPQGAGAATETPGGAGTDQTGASTDSQGAATQAAPTTPTTGAGTTGAQQQSTPQTAPQAAEPASGGGASAP